MRRTTKKLSLCFFLFLSVSFCVCLIVSILIFG